MMTHNFIKMHGLGNDFVILDGREEALALSCADVRALSDRQTGVGCDQLIILEPAPDSCADVFMRIYNIDGSQSGACGNATRCVASLIMAERSQSHVIVQTISGLLDCENLGQGLYRVDMGPARLDWRDVPLSEASNTESLDMQAGPLKNPVAVNVGNPHAVFIVECADNIALATFGPVIETHPLFPERTNVEVVHVIDRDHIRVRVWERGVGMTRACGSGACAALIATARRNLTERKADVVLDGGTLAIEWLPDNNVLMTGPVATSFSGTLNPKLRGTRP